MLFNRKASTNIIRHSCLSEKYKGVQEEMQRDAAMMAHTTTEQGFYIKNKTVSRERSDHIIYKITMK